MRVEALYSWVWTQYYLVRLIVQRSDSLTYSTHSSYPAIENTDETVLLSAHYDSRGSFGSVRAPGGDDDGSGTTAVIAMARTIARKGISFKKNVQLCLFAGEEQGLLGSRAYARTCLFNCSTRNRITFS